MTNGTQSIRRVLALATIAAALTAPAAWGAPVEQVLPNSTGNGEAQAPDSAPPSSPAPYVPSTPSSPPASASGDGFDWGDAGIGAMVMLALAAMAGGTLVLRHRPRRSSVA